MKMLRVSGFCLFFLLVFTFVANGDPKTGNGVWQHIDKTSLTEGGARGVERPVRYETFRLDKDRLKSVLQNAPDEFAGGDQVVIELPMPDGTLSRFRIEHSLVIEPGALFAHPELGATWRGQGIDDPTATVRFDLMPKGFHAIVISSSGTFYTEPFEKGNTRDYITYFHKDAPPDWFNLDCHNGDDSIAASLFAASGIGASPFVVSGANLRTYRLAIGATAEYTAIYGGGTVGGGLAALTTTVNLVDAIYEREVAVHLVLVANQSALVFTDTATDGYTHENISAMFNENQAKLDAVIGAAGYDIGHVFDGSTVAGGFSFQGQAFVPSVCLAGSKAKGIDILRSVPPSDMVAYYSVSHEMGHQFSATHMMNGTGTGCGAARTASTAFEPGSGSTIMGYRFNCATQDMQSSDTYFNVANLDQIVAYTSSGNGACSVPVATGNDAPTVSAGGNFTVPKITPFALTATATDPNGDPVTYTWEEGDLGAASPPDTDADGVARPIFRSYLGTTNPTRNFPSLTYILNNANIPPASITCPIFGGTCISGEALPTMTRIMTFRVTARDNRAIGGVASANMQVSVDAGSGPFSITSPNTNVTYAGGSLQTVAWSVSNTNNPPVSALSVKISYSSDGGITFPTVLVASTPNDGSQAVIIPVGNTTNARIKVEAVGNIFFDITDTNFTVSGVSLSQPVPFDYDGDRRSDVSVFRPSSGAWYLNRSRDGITGLTWGFSTDTITPADYDGDGKTDVAIFRPSEGRWYIFASLTSTFSTSLWGAATDIPTPADFDGDGKADISIFRPSDGNWWLNRTTLGTTTIPYGQTGDVPAVGDYDGDGKTDVAIFRPSNGVWSIHKSSGGDLGYQFGFGTDKIVQADYDGDLKTDIAVYRPSTGTWYIANSATPTFIATAFGAPTDIPTPGDYDGDGKADIAIFRPSDGNWWLGRSTAGLIVTQFGQNGDRPTQNAYGN